MRAWWELVKASAQLVTAKARGILRPCPPHEYDERWHFCVRCGKFPSDERG